MWKIVIGETAHLCSRLTRAFSERPEISTELVVGFFHIDAKEVFEWASASAHTLQSHHYQQTQEWYMKEHLTKTTSLTGKLRMLV